MLMTHEESAELTKPCVGASDDPAAFVTPEPLRAGVRTIPITAAPSFDRFTSGSGLTFRSELWKSGDT